MTDRPKLWRRICQACGQLDQRSAVIAPEQDGEAALAAEPWACPACGATEAIAARRMEPGDLGMLRE